MASPVTGVDFVAVPSTDWKRSRAFYVDTLGLRPDDAMSRNNLGLCLLEMGERDAGEASLRAAVRGVPQMAGLAITSLATASHGRFFLRPSAAAKFLRVEKT